MVQELPCEVHNAILYGLQKLAVLRLAFAPNERQLPDTAMVWLEMAARKGGWIPDDAVRVEHAFVRLAIELDKWPTPHQFFAYLPPRPVLPPPDTPLITPKLRVSGAKSRNNWTALHPNAPHKSSAMWPCATSPKPAA